MLSDHERRTLWGIEADLAASDPALARSFAASDHTPAYPRPRYSYLIWVIATCAVLLVLLSLAAGLPTGVFVCTTLVVGALVCHLNSGGHI